MIWLTVLALAACAQRLGPWSEGDMTRARVYTIALEEASEEPPAVGELRVRMAFGGFADLDLYVTDTLEETVYFARRESRTGGRLERDARCGERTPRVETARFPAAARGLYRIGVDYAEPCADNAMPVAFVIQVEYGGQRWVRMRRIEPKRFESQVWEFEIAELPGS